MRSRDEAQAAAAATVRLRAAAPVAAFALPAALLIAAGVAGTMGADGAVSVLVSLAAPTAVLVMVLFEDTPSLAVLVATMVASGPLWALLGRALAERVRNGRWRAFWRLYAYACAAWVVIAALALVLLG